MSRLDCQSIGQAKLTARSPQRFRNSISVFMFALWPLAGLCPISSSCVSSI
jgi:hypothetical protein